MTEQSDVKVFISWSGALSRTVALALRDWLPFLSDRVKPWASDTDIDAGQRGLAQIEAELTDTRFGIVVVTAENQHAPWLNFEAGALSRTVGTAEHRVVPLLVDLASAAELTGPLAQFQAKLADKEGVSDVARSLAAVAGVDSSIIHRRFEACWEQLQTRLDQTKSDGAVAPPARRTEADVLDEILLHVRALRAETTSTTALFEDLPLTSSLKKKEAVRFRHKLDERLSAMADRHGLESHGIRVDDDGALVAFVSVADPMKWDPEVIASFERYAAAELPGVRIVATPF